MPSTTAWLNALTDAIVRGNLDVESARALVIKAHSNTAEELREQVSLYPTVDAAAKALGVSRATLYRRMGLKVQAAHV